MLELVNPQGYTSYMSKQKKKTCYICKKIFWYYPREGYKNIVCSRNCNGVHQKNIGNKPPAYSGKEHPSWRGGGIYKKRGSNKYYKRITVNKKRVWEHRYVVEQHLGRKLLTEEHVHHINGDSLDNRIENLEVLSRSEHQARHHLGKRWPNGYKK